MSIYEDIMHLTRPISSHPRMHREDRAKLFAPFAALNGHSRAIHQRDAVLVPQVQKTDECEQSHSAVEYAEAVHSLACGV